MIGSLAFGGAIGWNDFARADTPPVVSTQPTDSAAHPSAAPAAAATVSTPTDEGEYLLPLTDDTKFPELTEPSFAPTITPEPAVPAPQLPAAPAKRGSKQNKTGPPVIANRRIQIRKFQQLKWSPGGRSFQSVGSVQLFYPDTEDANGPGTLLTANDVTADIDSGQVEAKGGIRLERPEGIITGQQLKYNFNSQAGVFTDAIVDTAYFRMSGKSIETQANGAYVVRDGYFTTCTNKYRYDYQIRAKRLTVSPNRYVAARNITFYAGGKPLISLPSYRRSLRTSSSAPLPTPSYNKTDGLTLRFTDSPIAQPHQTLDYDLRLSIRQFPRGYLLYQNDLTRSTLVGLPSRGALGLLSDPLRGNLEQLSPPTYREYTLNRFEEEHEHRTTFFATLQNEQFVYNRKYTDLLVSRFPEVGVQFSNILGRAPLSPETAVATRVGTPQVPREAVYGSTESVLERLPNSPFLFDVSAAAGVLRENPTKVTSGRFLIRSDMSTQPLLLGRRLSLRAGLTNWFNLYTRGTAYNLLSPEAELDYVPTRTSLFGVAYRYLTDVGRTPFLFDRRDVRHELRLRYQVGGPWAFGFTTRYDLERSRAYDSEVGIVRNFDCMQVGVAYRFRSQSFEILFNLLPPTPNRARRLRSLPEDIGAAASLAEKMDAPPSTAQLPSP